MKGIILAGGKGTRLYPLTSGVSKQLLPVYNKPMIYYPLSMLMWAGIREILIISTPEDISAYQRVLYNGERWGLSFDYAVQPLPKGLADAFIVGKKFINNEPVCLILGDNIFHGNDLSTILRECSYLETGAIIFAYQVKDPKRYGVVEFDENNKVLSLEEKPTKPKSNYSVPGIYFYDQQVCDFASNLKPSKRGELEILDLSRIYLNKNQLQVKKLSRGTAWLDAGTHESLLQASNYIQTVEERQGLMIACPEEIAYQMNFISAEQVYNQATKMVDNSYKKYLLDLIGA